MIEADMVEAVIGLGKNLFYNSSMESCLLVCRIKKSKERKGKIIFIEAKDEIRLERSTAYLKEEHIKRIANSYKKFEVEEGFSAIATNEDVLKLYSGNLSVQLYVKVLNGVSKHELMDLIKATRENQTQLNKSIDSLFSHFRNLGIEK